MFLDGLSATIPPGVHAVLVWDGAGDHGAKALRMPASLTFVGSPPYSPEWNPAERLRQHRRSNRVSEDVDALEEATKAGWRVA